MPRPPASRHQHPPPRLPRRHRPSGLAIGIDPGADTGIALVENAAGGLPVLRALHRIHGDRVGLWWSRAAGACRAIAALLAGSGMRLCEVPIWLEEPPVAKRGEMAGDKLGLRTWLGMGRRQGMLQAAFLSLDEEVDLCRIPVSTWTATWRNGVLPSKEGDGSHRVREASTLVRGAAAELGKMAAGQVDCAEACLIAGAAASWARGEVASIQQLAAAATIRQRAAVPLAHPAWFE